MMGCAGLGLEGMVGRGGSATSRGLLQSQTTTSGLQSLIGPLFHARGAPRTSARWRLSFLDQTPRSLQGASTETAGARRSAAGETAMIGRSAMTKEHRAIDSVPSLSPMALLRFRTSACETSSAPVWYDASPLRGASRVYSVLRTTGHDRTHWLNPVQLKTRCHKAMDNSGPCQYRDGAGSKVQTTESK